MPSVEASSAPEVTAKQSVEAAKAFARDVLAEDEFRRPRLEAVELSNDNEYWLVTISYAPEAEASAGEAADFRDLRSYKTLYVRASDGKVVKMTSAGRL